MKIGQIIDNLNVGIELDEDEIVVDAVVMVRTSGELGEGFHYRWSNGCSFMVRRGMLETARDIEATRGEMVVAYEADGDSD